MLLAAAAAAHIGLVRAHGLTGAGSGDASAARTPVRAGRAFVVRSALAWIFAAPLLVAAGALVSPGLGAAADPLGPTPHGIHPSWIFLPLVQLLRVAPARIGPLPGLESVLCAVALLWLALAFAPFLSLGGTRGPGPKTARALAIGALAALGLLGAWGFLQR
jgi:quinol-cytochrome oxidoreductase complex cytochrome b subunit